MSCLFNSLSHFISDISPQVIRERICCYLEANLPIIDGMTTHDVLQLESNFSVDQYISAMRQSSCWGGAIEIQSACNIWNARIMVHDIRMGHHSGRIIEFLPVSTIVKDNPNNTFVLEWSGGHYEPKREA